MVCLSRPYPIRFFKGCLPQILLGPFLNTLYHLEKDEELIKNVSDDCKICQIYRKSPPRPVVGLTMATSFKECVAMALKFHKEKSFCI